MNEALELANHLDDYARGDEYQRVTEEAATMLRSQAAEIEGWKNDQKENLRNQCDLHAEIERLKANANICGIGAGCLHKLATIESQAAEIEILKQEHAQRTMFKKTDDAAFVKQVEETTELRAENQKLRSNHERLQKLVDEGSASGLAYTASLALEAENQKLRDALTLALRQNEHDMLMTGDEIRKCEDALGETK